MEEVDKEISETRLSLNARTRIVAESYLATVGNLFRSTERALTSKSTVYMKKLVLCAIVIALKNLQGFQAWGMLSRATNERPNPLSAKYTRKSYRWRQKHVYECDIRSTHHLALTVR